MSKFTPAAERIAQDALCKAFAGGMIEVKDSGGIVLIKFKIPDLYTFTPDDRTVRFPAPAKAVVEKMGNPATYAVTAKDGRTVLVEGTAGAYEDKANMIIAKRLFAGMEVEIDGLEYRLKFGDRRENS